MCVYSVASTDKSDSYQYPEVLNEAMVCLMLEDPLSCSLLFSVSSSVTLQIVALLSASGTPFPLNYSHLVGKRSGARQTT